MAGYTRQDVSNNISNGSVIDADDLDNEFDAVAAAFDTSTGHSHSGQAGDGGPINVVGPAQEYVATSVSLAPKGNNLYDLGASSQRWKNFWVAGTSTLSNVDINGGAIDSTTIGVSTPSTGRFTSVVTTGDLTVGGDFVVDTVNVVTGNFDAANILLADINGGTIDGTVIGGTTPAAGNFTTTTVTNLTANGNISVTGTVDGVDVALLKSDFDTLSTAVTNNEDVFSTVAVATAGGTVNLVADQPQDTLNIAAGTGIALTANTSNDTLTIVNSAPDQVVTLTAGPSIGITGTYPNFTINNTAAGVEEIVINAGTGMSVTGDYPVFNLTNTAPDQVVTILGGTGISIDPQSSYPNFIINNSAPDQTVTITQGTGISVTGTYPNFTVTNSSPGNFYTAGAGISLVGTTFSHQDTSSQPGVINSGDTVIQSVQLDEFGHVTSLFSKTITAAGSGNIQISPSTGITGGGTFNVNQSTNQTVTLSGVTLDGTTWNAGTSTTEAVISPAKLSAAISAQSGNAGFGSVWRDRTGLRAVDTNYQNTTGKYLAVSVIVNSTESAWKTNTATAESVELKVGSTTSTMATRADVPSVLGFQRQTLFTIVPPNYWYSVVPLGTGRIISWHELD